MLDIDEIIIQSRNILEKKICGSKAVVSNLSMHQNHLEGLFKYSVSNLVGIRARPDR